MRRSLICAAMLALATTTVGVTQAFQLSCTHHDTVQSMTPPNGKNEYTRDDGHCQIAVDVNLTAKTLTFEGGTPSEITFANGVEIWAYNSTLGHSYNWTLNRLTAYFRASNASSAVATHAIIITTGNVSR